MTLYTDRKPREAVARAIWAGRMGYMERPDGGLHPFDRQPPGIQQRTRAEATAVLNLIRLNGWADLSLLDAIHAEEDANGEPRSSVVPGSGR